LVMRGTLGAGFVPVMDRTMILLGELGGGQLQPICPFLLHRYLTTEY
jgi:hypothetical protein